MEDEWQVATGGRRKRKTGPGAPAPPHGTHAACPGVSRPSQPPTERQVARCCATLDTATAELAATPFWAHLLQQLGTLPVHCALGSLKSMVIYGLGSLEQPGAVHIRYQLAAAKLLAALLPLAPGAAEAFDPVFTALDHAALAHCGIQLISHDEQGRRVAHHPTFFLMPHCEAALTDALLAANLAAGTLSNVVILGNRFSGYQLSWSLPHRAQQAQEQQAQQQAQQAQQGQQQQQGRGGGGRGDGLGSLGRSSSGGSNSGSISGGGSGGGATLPERPSTMLRLCERGVAREVRVRDCGFPVASAFNDLGLHWFPPDWRRQLEAAEGATGAVMTPAVAL